MRLTSHILCLLLVAATTSCRTRTESKVVAGPQAVSFGYNDYDPEREAREREAVLSGAGMAGVQGQGGAGFMERFGSGNPYGYETNPLQNKMFHGAGNAKKPDKMYHDRRAFLTRKYSETKELKKDNYNGVRSTHWEDRLFATEEAAYGDRTYRDSDRRVATELNRNAGRMAGTKNYRDGGRQYPTRMNYAAEKALEGDAEEPKFRDASPGERSTVGNVIGGRAPGERATIDEIRAFIGNASQ